MESTGTNRNFKYRLSKSNACGDVTGREEQGILVVNVAIKEKVYHYFEKCPNSLADDELLRVTIIRYQILLKELKD